MFVVSKRNIILPSPNGEQFRMAKDYMGPVPAWAEDSAYLKALAADGKVILSASGTDKDFAAGEKTSKRGQKGKGKKPEEHPKEEKEESDAPKEEDPSDDTGGQPGEGESGDKPDDVAE